MRKNVHALDEKIIDATNRWFVPLARIALFVIFFWFGFIKLFGVSPAEPLAQTLTAQTIGLEYFDLLFATVALIECSIGLLFLFPKAARVVIPLLLVHMAIVCSPLLLLPDATWQSLFVPTLEGQYIIKNAAIVALAIGIAANTRPLKVPAKR